MTNYFPYLTEYNLELALKISPYTFTYVFQKIVCFFTNLYALIAKLFLFFARLFSDASNKKPGCEYIVPIYSVCTCRNMELIINNENGIYYGENRFCYASPKGSGPKRKVYALTPHEGVSGGDDGTQYTR